MGDMNFEPGTEEYTRMVGPWSEKYGRLNNLTGLVDAWVAAGNTEDSGSTHPKHGCRIDHCFLSASLSGGVSAMWSVPDLPGSDHDPIIVDLDLPG